MRALALVIALTAPAAAETVTAARPVRAQAIITPEDLAVTEADTPGALSSPADAVGMEARVALYPGRPIRATDLRRPAVIERNALVTLSYSTGGLAIAAPGRALDRAAAGEPLRAMNLASRSTVHGVAAADGTVLVTSTSRGLE